MCILGNRDPVFLFEWYRAGVLARIYMSLIFYGTITFLLTMLYRNS